MSRLLSALPRMALGLLFIWASLDKIADPFAFARVIYNYQLVPDVLVNPIALGLPWIEMLCGVFLVLGLLRLGASLVVLLLMAVFMAALGYNLARGLDVACGCFSLSPQDEANILTSLLRDAAILALALGVYLSELARASKRNQRRLIP
ncbi:MauE/DoxX family redox-associated membrane protein [Desulfohalovibrio reitneri]|uniref:MauE/DoxX family redox-associated membrane protein n=1 Tax=Desulfohalovibrio reitneri TaxID=1307759 RepID=UPI00068B469B|nr:MauE/DoxX family redox-associated membrane protein [Desulfohalovibrio reitneri]